RLWQPAHDRARVLRALCSRLYAGHETGAESRLDGLALGRSLRKLDLVDVFEGPSFDGQDEALQCRYGSAIISTWTSACSAENKGRGGRRDDNDRRDSSMPR